MRVLLQRVSHASCTVDGNITGEINKGYLLFVGFTHSDNEENLKKAVKKITNFRIFEDEQGKMNLNLQTVGGDIFFDFKFMEFNNGPMEFNFEIAPKVSFPFAEKLFFRLGFSDLGVLKQDDEALAKNKAVVQAQNALYGSVVSPLIGVQLSNAAIGPAGLNLDLNYLLGGLIAGDYQALSLKAAVAIPFAELERVKLVFNIGARDTLLILKQGGIENHLSAIIGFGVENVIR